MPARATVASPAGSGAQVDPLSAGAAVPSSAEHGIAARAARRRLHRFRREPGIVASRASRAAVSEKTGVSPVSACLPGKAVTAPAAVTEKAGVSPVLAGGAVGAVADQPATVLARQHTVADEKSTGTDQTEERARRADEGDRCEVDGCGTR
ncbi:hypothetical protein [Mycolicibacterium vanbaalenii]|uniref:hypothetical protein n=1 Tax=Mycolicibacterium vanbaalenii TaxID=110539 RepID=UPI000674F9FC|nr:hypothetical protein [Mycolicibacterium vanbaalenii]